MTHYYPRLKSNSRFASRLVFTTICAFFLNQSQAQFGSYLSYDRLSNDYLVMPNNIVSSVTGSFTIETFINYKGGPDPFQRIFDFGTDNTNWVALTANSNVGAGGPRFAFLIGGALQAVDATTTLPLNTWTHIAVTLNGSTGAVSMYINGALSGTNNFTLRLSGLGSTNNNRIGESKYAGDPYLNADVDEFRISNTVRYTGAFTPPTVQFTNDANTVALFHFNEGSGQTTADASGNFSAATLGSNPSAPDVNDPSWMSILPVKLSEFSASAEDKKVALKWKASTDNATDFVIERSKDGARFTQVGQVSSSQSSAADQIFTFTDNSPYDGRSYYRLKCTELGQSPVYSRIAPVNFLSTGGLTVYPNPVKGSLITVETAKAVSGNIEMKIYNSSGAVVISKKLQVSNQQLFTISRSNILAAGNYTIEMIIDGKKLSKNVVLQ